LNGRHMCIGIKRKRQSKR